MALVKVEMSDGDIEMIVVALRATAHSLRKGQFEVVKSEITADDMDALAQRLLANRSEP